MTLYRTSALSLAALALVAAWVPWPPTAAQAPDKDALDKAFAADVRPILTKYCLGCHSTKAKKGSLDLERFATAADARKDLKPWLNTVEQVEAAEMPPATSKQPTAQEKAKLLAWARAMLDDEAKARAGDPGNVPMRRLSNAEYDNTVRDLTGVDLRPTREFPADGAAGEGFTNAAEALGDISPALLAKYLAAAKEVAAHAVLLPDGIRFSAGKTRRDWTDESTAVLRRFYAGFAPPDGRLVVGPYLVATVRHRDALKAGKAGEVASKEKLNAKYLAEVWRAMTDETPAPALDALRARWREAGEKDVPSLSADVAAMQAALWQTAKVGSYVRPVGGGYVENHTRQLPIDPPAMASVPLRATAKAAPGESEVVLRLSSRDLASAKQTGRVVWHRPRFEAKGLRPLLLRDYARYGADYEADFATAFAPAAKYLAAVAEAAATKADLAALAKKHALDEEFLRRWAEVLALRPDEGRRAVQAVALEPLDEKVEKAGGRPAINGWRKQGTDLPTVLSNSSDRDELIPGKASAGSVVVHPLPNEFVAVAWDAPAGADVSVAVRVRHAHPACGNGVAWWLEHRSGKQAFVVAEGAVGLGGEAKPAARALKLAKGDRLVLAVDANEGSHVCDLTEVALRVTETQKPGRKWDLSADVAASVLDGNPHPKGWRFVRGPSRPVKAGPKSVPGGSVLARWREAAVEPARKGDAARLAAEAQALLSGKRPTKQGPDLALYDAFVGVKGPLFEGIDVTRVCAPRPKDAPPLGLPRGRFGGEGVEEASLAADVGETVEVRLPAALMAGREFVVEGQVPDLAGRVVQFRAAGPVEGWDGKSAVVADPKGKGYERFVAGNAAFRRTFPLYLCFPQVIPTDEVVTLKMFHREDEPLGRLFLDAGEAERLDRLWDEHRFVSRQAIAERAYLPQFIGFVTQDQPKAMVTFFEGQRPNFDARAKGFDKQEEASVGKQLDSLVGFASRAYRRPLTAKESQGLRDLYAAVVKKGASPDEAIRGVLTRVLASPAFLFRVERAPDGKQAGEVDDWELATRLSYFLWATTPDDELRRLAAGGKLREPKALRDQAARMLKDGRVRSLAIEFGTQWIHVRNFDAHGEKNEKLFPTFDAKLRKSMYEESILFFQDLFREDRPVVSVLDSDATYLDEALAKHYGIPGVSGAHFRRVTGVRKYGRGGVLGLASVQAAQSGASRTSPVLRGNWVVETLLGEKLPRPPADVPRLPEQEKGEATTRQLVERHAKQASCAACHVRIDPYGFALERYDPIGRRRDKESSGLPIDAKAKLKDGTEFEGIDGLREHLLAKKKDAIVRLFCRRLLGYALGRAVTLSDTSLIDEMVDGLAKSDGRVSAAVAAVVRSKQFRMIRGGEHED